MIIHELKSLAAEMVDKAKCIVPELRNWFGLINCVNDPLKAVSIVLARILKSPRELEVSMKCKDRVIRASIAD